VVEAGATPQKVSKAPPLQRENYTQDTLVGIELMHMIKKRQLVVEEGDEGLTTAELFYSLAA
jgi:hypothetical protein